jgi:putative transposase
MSSVTLHAVAGQAASRIFDSEDVRFDDLDAVTAQMLKVVLEAAALTEVEQRLGRPVHARRDVGEGSGHAADYRNGYRSRRVQTSWMSMTIRLPRMRLSGYVPSFLRGRQRAVGSVAKWVYHALLSGVSRSELSRLMERLTGLRPSEKLLAEVQAELDREVLLFKQRRLREGYRYLFLDAAWTKDLVGRSTGRVCVLVAMGVTDQGKKELLGFERVRQENASSWRGFLSRLVGRGLDARSLGLVISDEHKGLLEAVPEVLGDVPHQLCWAHRVRNVRDAVLSRNKADWPLVLQGLRDIYRAPSMNAAGESFERFLADWQERYPAVANALREDMRYLLPFERMPAEHHRYIRTTNPLERVFREVRRWRRGCGAFADPAACDRVFYKVCRLLNERWADRDIWFERAQARKRRVKCADKLAATATTSAKA